MPEKQTLTNVLTIIIAALILCFMGFYNRFPLVYSDTGAYIGSGWARFVPSDRPIFYGLFLRRISLGDSLFLVIFAQGLAVSTLLYFWMKYFSKSLQKRWLFFLTLFVITFFTGASLNVSQLIPDIFAAVMMMSVILLLNAKSLSIRDGIIIALLLCLSLVVHNSHIYIGILCLMGYGFLLLFKQLRPFFLPFKERIKRSLLVIGMFGFSMLLIPIVHVSYGGSWSLSNGGHVFMMGRLVQLEIAGEYLEGACPDKGYKICEYTDALSRDFLWDYNNSPLYKTGGWEANKEEYQAIIKGVFTTPRFLIRFLLRSVEATFQQFFHFDLGDTTIKQHKETQVYVHVERFLPDQIRKYESSLQYRQSLDFDLQNVHQRYLLGFAVILSIALLFSNLIATEQKLLLGLVIIFLMANAAVCGSLSGVQFRYQCRVMWLILLPLFTMLWNRNFWDSLRQ